MSLDDDRRVFRELLAQAELPSSPDRTARITSLVEYADAEDLVHAKIFGRFVDMLDLTRITDVDHIIGTLADSQRLWRENSDRIVPDFIPVMLMQMALGILAINANSVLPLWKVETLRATYEQLCRRHGHTLRVPFRLAMDIAHQCGDIDRAVRYLIRLRAEPKDPMMIDQVGDEMAFLHEEYSDEAALRIYDSLDPDDPTVSWHYVNSEALLPLYRVGRRDEAAALSRMTEPDDPYPTEIAYLAMDGRYEDAIELLTRQLRPTPGEPETPYGIGNAATHATHVLFRANAAGFGDRPTHFLDGGTVREQLHRIANICVEMVTGADRLSGHQYGMTRLYRYWGYNAPEGYSIDDYKALIDDPELAEAYDRDLPPRPPDPTLAINPPTTGRSATESSARVD